ncbi:G5 domain-containing protein [Catellatospora chokoriensis]|uniref:G5 domain-containing protein n=1 Tax=Catellatospora chokoriensis TaxID=310353 RepID=A0A8J3NRB4_9ACTN|nr:G5 domain-containing protein [Catellatospora chokoriensis]GIF90027.1 hypothetical protein Cch02nite_34710 [Catellatospora chokoriensis]
MTHQTPGNPHPAPWPAAPKTGFLAGLGPGQKAGLFLGIGFVSIVLACCGGSAFLGAISGSPDAKPTRPVAAAVPSGAAATAGVAAEGLTVSPSPEAALVEPTPAEPVASPTPVQPVVEKRTVTETKTIAHGVKRVNDSTLAKGTTRVKTAGVNGTRKITYSVTLTDGVETSRVQVRDEVVKQPVTEVILVGTKVAATSSCDKNYSGCVPIASDVDCAGGSGNGPKYVRGPIRVIGSDIYDLDSDNDGVACE